MPFRLIPQGIARWFSLPTLAERLRHMIREKEHELFDAHAAAVNAEIRRKICTDQLRFLRAKLHDATVASRPIDARG